MCIFNYSNTNFKNNYIKNKNLLVSTKKSFKKLPYIYITKTNYDLFTPPF